MSRPFVFATAVCVIVPACFAQAPGMSRGEQLPSYSAAQADGNFWCDPKGPYYASIACNAAPDGTMWVNTVVACNRDGGAERVKLQQPMDGSAGGNSCLVGTDGSKFGRWGLTDPRTRTYSPSWPNRTDTLTASSDSENLA